MLCPINFGRFEPNTGSGRMLSGVRQSRSDPTGPPFGSAFEGRPERACQYRRDWPLDDICRKEARDVLSLSFCHATTLS
jgi:hypothetical protein